MAEDAVQKALVQIAELDAKSTRLKRWVNEYDIIEGNEPRFANVGDGNTATVVEGAAKAKIKGRFSPGDFFNKPFASAVKMIMTERYERNDKNPAPLSVDTIHEHLIEGSFDFGTSGADSQKNSIRISLGKNSTTFVKLPGSDLFGLAEWYGKKPKRSRLQVAILGSAADDDDDDGDDADDTNTGGDDYFTGEQKTDAETKTAEPVKPNFRRL
jgi:hypothetical protein